MSNRLRDLSDMISAMRSKHAKALAADLTRLRTQYGSVAVDHAYALSRQRELRSALSVSGQRVRRRTEGDAARELAEAVFVKR